MGETPRKASKAGLPACRTSDAGLRRKLQSEFLLSSIMALLAVFCMLGKLHHVTTVTHLSKLQAMQLVCGLGSACCTGLSSNASLAAKTGLSRQGCGLTRSVFLAFSQSKPRGQDGPPQHATGSRSSRSPSFAGPRAFRALAECLARNRIKQARRARACRCQNFESAEPYSPPQSRDAFEGAGRHALALVWSRRIACGTLCS